MKSDPPVRKREKAPSRDRHLADEWEAIFATTEAEIEAEIDEMVEELAEVSAELIELARRLRAPDGAGPADRPGGAPEGRMLRFPRAGRRHGPRPRESRERPGARSPSPGEQDG
jgi:hypothetical protein